MTVPEAVGPCLSVVGPPRPPEADAGSTPDPDALLLRMDAGGNVCVYSGKVEYGQRIRHGFAVAVAEELDIGVDSVHVILGDTATVPRDRGTTGSASTRTVGLQLRRAAATARVALIDRAARLWAVPGHRVLTRQGRAYLTAEPGKSVSYSELLTGQTLRLNVRGDVPLKSPERYQSIGQPHTRMDAIDRVTGRAVYSRDISLPGMLHGKVLRPPSYGARLVQVDTSRAERVPGVVAVVKQDDFVALVAEREDVADYALEVIRTRWEENRDTASDWNLPGLLKERAEAPVVLREQGSLEAGFDRAEHVIEGTYFVPYVANAQMEPSAAVAAWEDGRLTVWSGDRAPFSVRSSLALALGIAEDRVRVMTAEVGGSFGTKTPTVGLEAARLAKAVGKPVRVTYSRAEEFSWSTVRPAALIEIRSGTTKDGDIIAWEHIAYHAGQNAFRGRRGADTPYKTSNVRVAVANSESPLSSGSYRSLGGAVNHFAREAHMDEIASRLEMDPYELRLRNLEHPRFRRVLELAAREFGWTARRPQPAVGNGVALGYDAGSYVAECVELDVDRRDVRVRRVVAAFDCGLVVSPDDARNQVEGSIMMGIGAALWEAVEFDGGRVLNPGFGRYRVPRIADAPDINVVLIDDPINPSTGAGEPGIVPIAAAVANAVRNATGLRIDRLPIVPHMTSSR